MIRVGGDYQAQIPEFKPGKLGERVAREKGSADDERNEGQMTRASVEIQENREKGRNVCVSFLQLYINQNN